MTVTTSTEQTTVEGVRDLFHGLLKERDLSDPSRYWTDDACDHFVALGLHVRGPQALAQFFQELFDALPDWDMEIDKIVVDGRDAVVQWTASGTFCGTAWQGLESTGKRVKLPAVDVIRLAEDGRVQSNTVYWDGMDLMRQAGLLPPRDSLGERAMNASLNAMTRLRRRLSGRR